MATSRYTEHRNTGYNQSETQQQPDEHYPSTFFCRALYDYQSQDPSSLSFTRSDVIEVLTQLESGWWDGLLNDERGWFPSNYVERISDHDAETYFVRSASESSSMQSDSQSSTAFDGGSTLDSGQGWTPAMPRQTQVPNDSHRSVISSGSTSNDFWVPRMTPNGEIYYQNTQTGERSRDLPPENEDDSAYPNHLQSLSPSEAPPDSVPTSLRNKAYGIDSVATNSDHSRQDYAGFGIPKRSGTPEPWIKRLADDGISYCYVNKIDGQVVRNRPVANSTIAPSMTTGISSTNGPASLSSMYGQLSNAVGDTYEAPQRMRSDSATSPQKASSTSSRRLSVYSDDSDVQPPFLKPSSQAPRGFDNVAFQQESGSWSNIESTMPDGVEEEPIELTAAERAAQKLQEAVTPAPGESIDELAEAVYITIDSVIRSVDNYELSNDQDRATEVENLVSAVVESIRNLLYTSCVLSGPLPSYIERDSLSHSLPSAATQQLQAHLKTSQRKVTATLSKLVLSARAAYFKRENLSNDMMVRVQQDADDLQRAVHGFVVEAQKQYSKTAFQELNVPLGRKRLRGAYTITQLGLGLPGGGAGASWKGLGYVALRDMTYPPRRQLSQEVFISLKECQNTLDEVGVLLLRAKSSSLNDYVSLLLKLFSDMSSFLLLIADIHLSQYLDVDGVHRDAQEPYKEHVRKAQTSLRFFEVLIQSIYDDTAETFLLLQETAFGFWLQSEYYIDQTLETFSSSSQSKITKAISMVEGFLTIAHDQENEARNDYRESIGWRIDHTQPEGTLPLSSLFPPGEPEPEDAVGIEYALSGPTRPQLDVLEPKQDQEPGGSVGSPSLEHHNLSHPDDLDDGPYADDELLEKSKAPPRATKIRKFFGDDAPENYIESANADSKPWYLRVDHRSEEITVNPDGKVIAGTLPALVERLTAHESGGSNPIFHKTFLMTYKSFTTLNELFDLLVKRYRIQPPDGLKPKELEEWKNVKQYHIRLRVINTFKSMLTDEDVLDKDDMYILDSIKDFLSAPDVASLSAAKNLLVVVERARNGGDAVIKSTASNPSTMPQSIVPKAGKKFKFLDVDPLEMARQLTLYESRLYNKITAIECLTRAREQKVGEHQDHIADIIQVTNKIANWVADTILSKEDSRKRASIIKHFIAIADKCRTLHNFSSMVAITSGLNSPPVRRLKRTWEHIGSRHMSLLGTCERTFDTGKNFNNYRATLAKVNPPCVPFIGVYLSTLTFIQDGSKDVLPGNLINFSKRQKAAEVIREIKHWQSKPFSLHPLPQVQAFIEDRLNSFNDSTDWSEAFWNKSLECEPREREDEKMARLLQESGFL